MAGRKDRGTPTLTVRFPRTLLSLVDDYVRAADARNRESGVTRTDFILAAVRMKLAHITRSNRKRPQRTPAEKVADKALALVTGPFPRNTIPGQRTRAKEGA